MMTKYQENLVQKLVINMFMLGRNNGIWRIILSRCQKSLLKKKLNKS